MVTARLVLRCSVNQLIGDLGHFPSCSIHLCVIVHLLSLPRENILVWCGWERRAASGPGSL